MITQREIRKMILEEVTQAKREVAARQPSRLTHARLREIILQEAAALRSHREIHGGMTRAPKFGLVEAIMGSDKDLDEAGPGIILSNPMGGSSDEVGQCEQCGAMYESPIAKCAHCGAKLEYVSRGMSGLGKMSNISERKKDRFSGISQGTAGSVVDRIERKPAPTFQNVLDAAKKRASEQGAAAAPLTRRAGSIPKMTDERTLPREVKKRG
jgi:hypothetical protein